MTAVFLAFFVIVFGTAVGLMVNAYRKQQRRGLEAHKKLKAAALKKRRVPPRPAQVRKSPTKRKQSAPSSSHIYTQDIRTVIEQTVQEARENNEPVYRDDFQVDQIEDYLTKVADHMSLSAEEREGMLAEIEEVLSTLPKREEKEDDICPECGQPFAVQDDYICKKCRIALG